MNVKEWWDANPPSPPDPAALEAGIRSLLASNPSIPVVTALAMAGDRLQAERATRMVEDGVPVRDCLVFIGSFSRIGWLLDMAYAGRIAWPAFYPLLVEHWPGSDPDDTDPRLLVAWHGAWEWNRRRTLGASLPPGRHLTVYRGQGRADPVGIAWSLHEDVAARFANGAGYRVPGSVPDPVVLSGRVHRRRVLAYLTSRNEAEVIVDPFHVMMMRP